MDTALAPAGAVRAALRSGGSVARRGCLIERAFGAHRQNPSYRARLRVEIGRLRHELRPLAGIRATAGGFSLVARGAVRLLHA